MADLSDDMRRVGELARALIRCADHAPDETHPRTMREVADRLLRIVSCAAIAADRALDAPAQAPAEPVHFNRLPYEALSAIPIFEDWSDTRERLNYGCRVAEAAMRSCEEQLRQLRAAPPQQAAPVAPADPSLYLQLYDEAERENAELRARVAPAERAGWVPMHEGPPPPDTDCAVVLRYTLDRPPFVATDRWEMHREDPTGMGGPTLEMGYCWRDNYEGDVIAWLALPEMPPAEWDQRLPDAAPQPAPEPLCMCKDRPAKDCPGEWEPGCDLGNNEKFCRPAHPSVAAAVDAAIGLPKPRHSIEPSEFIGVPMRTVESIEDLKRIDPDGEPVRVLGHKAGGVFVQDDSGCKLVLDGLSTRTDISVTVAPKDKP